MARLLVLVSADAASSVAAYEAATNAALASLLSHTFGIYTAEITDKPPSFIRLMRAAFDVQTGGTVITHPYKVKVIQGGTEADVVSIGNAFMAANPSYWFAPGEFVYSDLLPNVQNRYLFFILYNEDAADGAANWNPGFATGIVPGGAAGGDLGGFYPNPIVVGIEGIAIDAAPTGSGAQLVYDLATNKYYFTQPTMYFMTGAAAQAAAPFINGTTVVINPGSPTTEAGTYQVTTNGGAAFPADYTKVDDNTNTAAEVSIVDAGGYYPAPKEVETALQDIGTGIAGVLTTVLAAGANVVDTVPVATGRQALWSYTLEKGAVTYAEHNRAVNDGVATPSNGAYGTVLTAGVIDVVMTVDISAGDMRLIATAASAGWSIKYRRLELTG